ncbi:MAG TPA: tRNA(Met) cytidine acetyltransferase TmcA domain-containing protein, partial [Halobacteriales archaeon]|nr:tRNA(Met) cytidine acetyltransferase TmcA domain-containing protein [Halobacteriales archaeon]
MIEEVVGPLRQEALAANERRLLVLAGSRPAGLDAASGALDAAGIDPGRAVAVGPEAPPGVERVPAERARDLLGTTRDAVILDAHDRLDPNAVGQTVGVVDGGGLFVLVTPPLDDWARRRDDFDESLAVPPFDAADVAGRFRRRFVDTLRAHPGIAIVDVDAGRVERDGLTHPDPRRASPEVHVPEAVAFPRAAYEACLTDDQVRSLSALEALRGDGQAVVIESDRGRGKSSVAGLAAACLAAAGEDVAITAPAFPSARPAFERAVELVDALGERADGSGGSSAASGEGPTESEGFVTRAAGRLRYLHPDRASDADPDVLLVDEAAAFPVARLEAFLDAERVGFTTTIHGYEGAGRGF